jgi:hypothetical protein
MSSNLNRRRIALMVSGIPTLEDFINKKLGSKKLEYMNTIYCDICDQASIETEQEITEETFYCCTMCRDNNKEREIKNNNFNKEKVIDYKN